MPKNIIIGGAARSGKTILCQHLNKELGYSHIPTDALVGAFGDVFTEHGIMHVGLPHNEICTNFETYLHKFLVYMDYINVPFVLDSYHILPEFIVRHGWHEHCAVAFLGFPDISVEEKIAACRIHKNAKDWTEEVSDEELRNNMSEFIDVSRKLRDECVKYNLPFYNTGADFNAALEDVFENIKELPF